MSVAIDRDLAKLRPFAASQRTFFVAATLLFAASTTATIAMSGSMSAMHEMPMPGGWTMSMMWMRMPGQSWPGAAAAFLGMWLVMMVAMMAPVLTPVLLRYRRAIAATPPIRADALTAVVAAAYFSAWTLFGAIAFVIGAAMASFEMQLPLLARGVPFGAGAIVLLSGLLQFSAWKARYLACCRATSASCATIAGDLRTAVVHGLRLGQHCLHCCCGLTIVLLAVGVMDLRAMALVTAAVTVERLAPGGDRAARFVGAILVVAGCWMVARALSY